MRRTYWQHRRQNNDISFDAAEDSTFRLIARAWSLLDDINLPRVDADITLIHNVPKKGDATLAKSHLLISILSPWRATSVFTLSICSVTSAIVFKETTTLFRYNLQTLVHQESHPSPFETLRPHSLTQTALSQTGTFQINT